jgi:polyhydroxyalkanoate synthase subunit PhaE
MDEQNRETGDPQSLLEMWVSTSANFWGSTLKAWSSSIEQVGGNPRSRTHESLETSLKAFGSLFQIMAEPDAAKSLFRGISALPEIASKMLEPALLGMLELQRQALERAGRINQSTAAYSFENLDQEVFQAWLEVYEREFKRFLTIPQVGLLRFYQERVNEASDKFQVLQTTMMEFLSILALPMEKSFKVMQEKLSELADDGKLPENTREYYRMWIKILEGHYMNLFKSPHYNEAMGKTLGAMSDFAIARRKIIEDALQSLPIPTHKELDELYKELYTLKIRIRELEKKIDRSDSVNEA